jgi:hypothetical protein
MVCDRILGIVAAEGLRDSSPGVSTQTRFVPAIRTGSAGFGSPASAKRSVKREHVVFLCPLPRTSSCSSFSFCGYFGPTTSFASLKSLARS